MFVDVLFVVKLNLTLDLVRLELLSVDCRQNALPFGLDEWNFLLFGLNITWRILHLHVSGLICAQIRILFPHENTLLSIFLIHRRLVAVA